MNQTESESLHTLASPVDWDHDAWDRLGRQIASRGNRIKIFPRWLHRLRGLQREARPSTLKAMLTTWALYVGKTDPGFDFTPGDIEDFLDWPDFIQERAWKFLVINKQNTRAIELLSRALKKTQMNSSAAHSIRSCLSGIYRIVNQHEEALSAVEPIHEYFCTREDLPRPQFFVSVNLWYCLNHSNRTTEGERYYSWMSQDIKRGIDPYDEACIHCLKGETDSALSLLRSCDLFSKRWPLFDPDLKELHHDSRFIEWVEQECKKSQELLSGIDWPPCFLVDATN